jgi:hypothetical protein
MSGSMTTRQRQNLWIVLAGFALVLVATLEIGAEVHRGRPGDHPRQLHGDARQFAVIPVTDDGVRAPTAAQRANAEAGLAAMQRWLGAHGGAVVTRATDVLLTDHDHCPSSGQHPEAAGVTLNGKKICLFTADTPELEVPTLLRQTAAHEAVHVLQGQLGCAAPLPSWLVEGMAEDLSWRTILPHDDEATLERWAAMEQGEQADGLNYGTAMRAALDLDGGRPARLVDFCRAVGQGAPWRLAFSQTFDASADQYAARF